MLDEDEFNDVTSRMGTGTAGSIRERRFGPMLVEYEGITGYHAAKPDAIWHHRLSLYGDPCPHCGKPLRTPQAKLCAACMKAVRRVDNSA